MIVLCVIDRFLSRFADDNVQLGLTTAGMFTYLHYVQKKTPPFVFFHNF